MKFMRSWRCLAAVLMIGLASVRGDEASPAADGAAGTEFSKLNASYNTAMEKFGEAYQAAKTDAERNEVISNLYPQPTKYSGGFLSFARQFPKSSQAPEALLWVIRTGGGDTADSKQALELLQTKYLDDDPTRLACFSLCYSRSDEATTFLRMVLAKSSSRGTQAAACLSLARLLKNQNGNRAEEAEKLFERAASDFADVPPLSGPASISEEAKHELYEIHNLNIGKTAPEIAGADVDGNPFKLSDYRGKIVVVDFWGRW